MSGPAKSKSPHYGSQTKARKAALDLLYAADLRGDDMVMLLSQQRQVDDRGIRELTSLIVHGVADHLAEIDARLADCVSENWSVQRMPTVDRNLARMAIFELDHTDTPAPAVISEAVKLATELSTDGSPTFLNGLLAKALSTSPRKIEH